MNSVAASVFIKIFVVQHAKQIFHFFQELHEKLDKFSDLLVL